MSNHNKVKAIREALEQMNEQSINEGKDDLSYYAGQLFDGLSKLAGTIDDVEVNSEATPLNKQAKALLQDFQDLKKEAKRLEKAAKAKNL